MESTSTTILAGNPLLEAAITYAEHHQWAVFPLRPRSKVPREGSRGFKDATKSLSDIKKYWKYCPNDNIGVASGAPSGFWVLDVDPKHGGDENLAQLEKEYGALPSTWRQITGTGGQHIFFKYTVECEKIKNSVGKIAPGLDVRTSGGYIVVAPSIHPDTGQEYAFAPDHQPGDTPLANAPEWLLQLALDHSHKIKKKSKTRKQELDIGNTATAYGRAALEQECKIVSRTLPGSQEETLNAAALKIGGLVKAGEIDHQFAFNALLEAGMLMQNEAGRSCWSIEAITIKIERGFKDAIPREKKKGNNLPIQDQDTVNDNDFDEKAEFSQKRRERVILATEEAVRKLNENHALVLVGGKTLVLREDTDTEGKPDLKFMAFSQFSIYYKNERIEVPAKKGYKMMELAYVWLESKQRRSYIDVVFAPGGCGPKYYNLFKGWSVKPLALGSCEKFKDHLLNNICQGDMQLYAWVTAFFAQMFQKPEVKPGVSLVLRGKQGTGKTKVGEIIGSLLGSHYVLVDNPKHVTGQFNSHMASALLLQADEGFWAGDKTAEGKIKSLITSKLHLIEKKGVDPIKVNNHIRLLITTNSEWAIPAGLEERRFCVVDAGDNVMQDTAYFAALDEEMDNGGREALLYYLLNFDLSIVNLHEIPRTEALFEQKLYSLLPEQKWWFECLDKGISSCGRDEWPVRINCEELFLSYLQFSEQQKLRQVLTERELGVSIRRLVPGIKRKKARNGKKLVWVYLFPDLETCRKAFEELIKAKINWDDTSELFERDN
jgi:hypothetical protein